ncbi:unnamed protein product [Owenia fusiformis]|uniref:Uncharacterized protein n=1 Tax=Owenia fusiformis TaxID=6347 RepID=A0A8J1TRX6_OWEFU|nr:unnamed protein product [Owenia fusiformis]
MKFCLKYGLVIALCIVLVKTQTENNTTQSESTSNTPTTSKPSTTQTPKVSTGKPGPPTTVNPETECERANSTCETCVAVAKCLWCNTGKQKCKPYPVGDIIPRASACPLDDARWGVCWVNFKVLLIVMGVIGGVILLSLGCCIYCCCCRSKGNRTKYLKEEAKMERDREDRKLRSDERRADRQKKHDEIRKKYGLVKDDNPYQRFDA